MQKQEAGKYYQDNDFVLAQKNGRPLNEKSLSSNFAQLAEELGYPKVVFHSLRHSSTTYKLMLTGGDIKSVQGDTGHADAKMVLDVYSHILEEGRRDIALLFEKDFYDRGTLTKDEKRTDFSQPVSN
jgi:Phage integrase family.